MTLACVVLAHADPIHVRRLVAALEPFPVYLHCDSRTSPSVYAEMTDGLPSRCRLMPRIATGWARWQNVEAELTGYRLALQETDATHVATMTGTDYPIAPAAAITARLAASPTTSFAHYDVLPKREWGRSGGLARLRYPHWAYRKHMLRVPIPRPLPDGVVPAGGSQVKVLSRAHAATVVDVTDRRPDLVRFWRRSWVPDETYVASIVSTPALCPNWSSAHCDEELWHIGWSGTPQKSPPWLVATDFALLESAQAAGKLFARKFNSATGTELLDLVDRRLRV